MDIVKNKARIVCTIGPASDSIEVLEQLLNAGMNIARLNFSHGDFSGHERLIKNIRQASQNPGIRIAIMAYLPGPKIRIDVLEQEPVELKEGNQFVFTADDISGLALLTQGPSELDPSGNHRMEILEPY